MHLQANHAPRVTPPTAHANCRNPNRTRNVYSSATATRKKGSINPGHALSTHSLGDEPPVVAATGITSALRRNWLTEVMKPDGRQNTLKHGKVLVEAIAAGIEPLEFRRKVEINMRFDLVTHYPDALFNVVAKQQRDQAVIEANDAERRQTAK